MSESPGSDEARRSPPDESPVAGGARRGARAPVVLAAVLTLGAIGGVVGSALVRSGSPEHDREAAAHSVGSPPKAEYQAPGRPMPAGCEVESANAPALTFVDLPGNRLVLGAFAQGANVERKVTVRNTGRGMLCIRDVETGCGCVKAEWSGDAHVAPSASGTLSIRIDTTGKEGVQEKWVTLYSNDPKVPFGAVITVVLDVRLGLVVRVTPGALASELSFGTHTRGKPASATMRLKCPRSDPAWTILGVESAAQPESRRSKFEWVVEPVEPNDPDFRCYDLRITHPGRPEAGRDDQLLRITTSHPERPEIQVRAELTVVEKYYAAPTQAGFGSVRAREVPPSRTVEVKSGEAGGEFRVTVAKIEGSGFLTGEPRRLPDGWAVDVRYDGQVRAAGRIEATLVISIDDRDLPELKVPLVATVAAP